MCMTGNPCGSCCCCCSIDGKGGGGGGGGGGPRPLPKGPLPPNRVTLPSRQWIEVTLPSVSLILETAARTSTLYAHPEVRPSAVGVAQTYSNAIPFLAGAPITLPAGTWWLYLDDAAGLDVLVCDVACLPREILDVVRGWDGTNRRPVKVDTAGELQIDVLTVPANQSVNVAQYGGTAVGSANPLDVGLRTVGGTVQTARDWSGDLDNLQGIPPDQELTNIGARLKVTRMEQCFVADHTVTALGASATYTGSATGHPLTAAGAVQDLGNANAQYRGRTKGVVVFADQAGTIRFQVSIDGGTAYRILQDVAYVASTVIQQTRDFLGAIRSRVQFVNGGVAQGTFELDSIDV